MHRFLLLGPGLACFWIGGCSYDSEASEEVDSEVDRQQDSGDSAGEMPADTDGTSDDTGGSGESDTGDPSDSAGDTDDSAHDSAGADTGRDLIAFEVVMSGEVSGHDATGNGESCESLFVALVTSEDELTAALARVQVGLTAPKISWHSDVALVSYILWCSSGKSELVVETLEEGDGGLDVHEVRLHHCWSTAAISRPYNVISFARTEATTVSASLSWENYDSDTGC